MDQNRLTYEDSQTGIDNEPVSRPDYEKIEKQLRKELRKYEKLAETDWLVYLEDVAVIQWQLANLYVDMQRYGDAERMYLQSLATRKEFDEEDEFRYFPGTAQCHRSLGRLYERNMDYSQAETCYSEAVALLRRLWACENERCNVVGPLKISLGYLAELYRKTGQDTKAVELDAEMRTLAAE